MIKDEDGFVYPDIDAAKCVGCNICDEICPINHPFKESCEEQKSFSAWARNDTIRNRASSGGIFELLASQTINNDGVVFGAAFDENLKLRHMGIHLLSDLPKLCKSKYLQSNVGECYTQVRQLLEQNKKVLFVGTPCQVAALKKYLGTNNDSLLTADFICHGVPSQDMFDRCRDYEEKKHHGIMKEFSFRVKDGKIKHIHGYAYVLKCGGKDKKVQGLFYENPFYFGFKKYLFLRPSCYKCPYTTIERGSDITLADFWGIEEYMQDVDFRKGVSMILTNTEKGVKAFQTLRDRIDCRNFDMEVAVKCNEALTKATKMPKEREKAFQDLHAVDFPVYAKLYLKPQKYWVYKMFYSLPNFVKKLTKKFLGSCAYE